MISPKLACCAAFFTDTRYLENFCLTNSNEGEHVEPVCFLKSFRKTDLKKRELFADRDCACQWLLESISFRNNLIQNKTQAAKIIPLYDFTEYQGTCCTQMYLNLL